MAQQMCWRVWFGVVDALWWFVLGTAQGLGRLVMEATTQLGFGEKNRETARVVTYKSGEGWRTSRRDVVCSSYRHGGGRRTRVMGGGLNSML
jgi:hypothetical protein